MNSLVTFRSNSEGNLLPTSKQREAASAEVVSTFKAKLMAAANNAAAAQAASTPTAKSTAASSASSAASSTASSTAKSASSSSDSTALSKTQNAYQELNSEAFLKMLAVQLQNQDPTAPMDDSQMMAQLAQFSSLQQMTEMNSNMAQLNFLSAQSMLGKYVAGTNDDKETVAGIVDGVALQDNVILLSVGGKTLPMTGVVGVALEAPADNSTQEGT